MSHSIRYLLPLVAVLVLSACGVVAPAGKVHAGTVAVTAPVGECWIGGFEGKATRGCGSRTFRVRDQFIDVSAQKATGGAWKLELTLLVGGKVINQQYTTESYGVVEVTEQTHSPGAGI